MSAAGRITTPLHIGLGKALHHVFGSNNLVELLNKYGFCASYSDVRKFLTSLAEQFYKWGVVENGVFIPSGMIARNDGGCLIDEGCDNDDINYRTIDGKSTFHAMARVVFQVRSQKYPLPERKITVDTVLRCEVPDETLEAFVL